MFVLGPCPWKRWSRSPEAPAVVISWVARGLGVGREGGRRERKRREEEEGEGREGRRRGEEGGEEGRGRRAEEGT